MSDDTDKTPVSLCIPADILKEIQTIAKSVERDAAWVITRALRQYLSTEGHDILEEAAGLASLDRGEGHDFDQVMADGEAIIAAAEAKRAPKEG